MLQLYPKFMRHKSDYVHFGSNVESVIWMSEIVCFFNDVI